jgi:hypothetical protein
MNNYNLPKVKNRLLPGKTLNQIGLKTSEANYLLGWYDAIKCLIDETFLPDTSITEIRATMKLSGEMIRQVRKRHKDGFESLISIMPTERATPYIMQELSK